MADNEVENIITRISIEGADKTQADALLIREAINALKTEIVSLSQKGAGLLRPSDIVQSKTDQLKAEIEEYRKVLEEIRNTQAASIGIDPLSGNARTLSSSEKLVNAEAIKEAEEDIKATERELMLLGKAAGEVAKEFKPAEESTKALANAQQQLVNTTKPLSEILRNVGANAGKSKEGMDAWRAGVDGIKASMTNMAQVSGKSITEVGAQFKREAGTMGGTSAEVKTRIQAINQAMKELKPTTKNVGQSFSELGTIGKYVFGTILGINAIQVLQSIIGYLKQAAVAGYEFAKSMYQLQIGVNAIRRTGVEITLRDVTDNLDELQKKFGIFSRTELVKGSAALLNLTRDFRFTKEEIFSLQESIATLAIVNGRAMDDVQKTVALAVSSGYTEGLQRLGVSINRVTIAMEAQRLGWGRNYMSLTEVQRAAATYNLILAKTAKYSEDLLAYQKTAPGIIDSTKASWVDFTTELGNSINPLSSVVSLLDVMLDRLIHLGRELNKSKLGDALKQVGAGFAGIAAAWKIGGNPFAFGTEANTAFLKAQADYLAAMKEPPVKSEAEILAEEEAQKLTEIAQELGDKLVEIQDDYQADLLENQEDYSDKASEIGREYAEKALDIQRQYAQKLADIDLQVVQKREDAFRDYNQSLQDIAIWYNNAVADANAKHRQDEIDAEIEFQRKMRELRQKFLFDMEGAIQERDARAALNLIRQYNFDKANLVEGKKDDKKDTELELQRELAAIRRQRAEKEADLKIELSRKLAAIQLEYQRELEELALWKKREYEERERWLKAEFDQAKANFIKQNNEAIKARDKKLRDLVNTFTREYKLTAQQWTNLFKLTQAYIGPNGALVQMWRNYSTWLQQLQMTPMSGVVPPSSPVGVNTGSTVPPAAGMTWNGKQWTWGGKKAMGGSVVANTPTYAMFGERGPEMATFTPLSGSRGGSMGGGKVTIALSLPPKWEANIIDSALGQVADVILELHKERA